MILLQVIQHFKKCCRPDETALYKRCYYDCEQSGRRSCLSVYKVDGTSEWNGFWNRLHSGFLSFYPLNRRLYSSEYRSSKSNHRRRTWRAQIPIWSRVSIAGVPIQEYCENVGLRWGENIRKDISDKVREMGATIIKGKGRTHYGIATCVCYLAEAVLNQRLTIAPVSTMFQGEYGIEDVCLSVPSIIGVNGVEKRLEERWAEEEFLAFRQAS